jgi:hypothetical protein
VAISATVRDEVDLNKLTERLVNVVQETMQPEHVSLWLKKTDDGRPRTTGGRRTMIISEAKRSGTAGNVSGVPDVNIEGITKDERQPSH